MEVGCFDPFQQLDHIFYCFHPFHLCGCACKWGKKNPQLMTILIGKMMAKAHKKGRGCHHERLILPDLPVRKMRSKGVKLWKEKPMKSRIWTTLICGFLCITLVYFGVGSRTILTQKIYSCTFAKLRCLIETPWYIQGCLCNINTIKLQISNIREAIYYTPPNIGRDQGSKPIVWLEKLAIQLPDITRPLVPCYPGQEISTVRWQPFCRGHRSCLAA